MEQGRWAGTLLARPRRIGARVSHVALRRVALIHANTFAFAIAHIIVSVIQTCIIHARAINHVAKATI